MNELKPHPAAEAFPMMASERFAELVNDIESGGLLQPIVICDGMILDGRNRFKACTQLGITADSVNFDGDPWKYAWSLNGARRDLVQEQRYLIWKFLSEGSDAFQSELKRIDDEANEKRSKAARTQPRTETGFAEKDQVAGHTAPPPDKEGRKRQSNRRAARFNGSIPRTLKA